eukprot:g529.t1
MSKTKTKTKTKKKKERLARLRQKKADSTKVPEESEVQWRRPGNDAEEGAEEDESPVWREPEIEENEKQRKTKKNKKKSKAQQLAAARLMRIDDAVEAHHPGFAPMDGWKGKLFRAIQHGSVEGVRAILEQKPMATNARVFDMGMSLGVGEMRIPDCSSPLHLAAWLGQCDIVRFLLNVGASPDLRDGLNQLPCEVASNLDTKRVLGAASGMVALDRKVEESSLILSNAVSDLNSKARMEIAKVRAHLGELEASMHSSIRISVAEEVDRNRDRKRAQLSKEDLRRWNEMDRRVQEIWDRVDRLRAPREDDDSDRRPGTDDHQYMEECQRKLRRYGDKLNGQEELIRGLQRELRSLRRESTKAQAQAEATKARKETKAMRKEDARARRLRKAEEEALRVADEILFCSLAGRFGPMSGVMYAASNLPGEVYSKLLADAAAVVQRWWRSILPQRMMRKHEAAQFMQKMYRGRQGKEALKAKKAIKFMFNRKVGRIWLAWRRFAHREVAVRQLIRKHVVGQRATCFDAWKANAAEARERRQTILRRVRDRKLLAVLYAWVDATERAVRVKRMFMSQCAKSKLYFFEKWHDKTVEIRMLKQTMASAWAAAATDVQRMYRGYVARSDLVPARRRAREKLRLDGIRETELAIRRRSAASATVQETARIEREVAYAARETEKAAEQYFARIRKKSEKKRLRALAREALDMIKYHEEGDVKTGTSRTTSEMIRAMIVKEEQHVREIAAEKATMKFRESQPARFACANCGASFPTKMHMVSHACPRSKKRLKGLSPADTVLQHLRDAAALQDASSERAKTIHEAVRSTRGSHAVRMGDLLRDISRAAARAKAKVSIQARQTGQTGQTGQTEKANEDAKASLTTMLHELEMIKCDIVGHSYDYIEMYQRLHAIRLRAKSLRPDWRDNVLRVIERYQSDIERIEPTAAIPPGIFRSVQRELQEELQEDLEFKPRRSRHLQQRNLSPSKRPSRKENLPKKNEGDDESARCLFRGSVKTCRGMDLDVEIRATDDYGVTSDGCADVVVITAWDATLTQRSISFAAPKELQNRNWEHTVMGLEIEQGELIHRERSITAEMLLQEASQREAKAATSRKCSKETPRIEQREPDVTERRVVNGIPLQVQVWLDGSEGITVVAEDDKLKQYRLTCSGHAQKRLMQSIAGDETRIPECLHFDRQQDKRRQFLILSPLEKKMQEKKIRGKKVSNKVSRRKRGEEVHLPVLTQRSPAPLSAYERQRSERLTPQSTPRLRKDNSGKLNTNADEENLGKGRVVYTGTKSVRGLHVDITVHHDSPNNRIHIALVDALLTRYELSLPLTNCQQLVMPGDLPNPSVEDIAAAAAHAVTLERSQADRRRMQAVLPSLKEIPIDNEKKIKTKAVSKANTRGHVRRIITEAVHWENMLKEDEQQHTHRVQIARSPTTNMFGIIFAEKELQNAITREISARIVFIVGTKHPVKTGSVNIDSNSELKLICGTRVISANGVRVTSLAALRTIMEDAATMDLQLCSSSSRIVQRIMRNVVASASMQRSGEV